MELVATDFSKVKNLYSYNEYKNMVHRLFMEGEVTGDVQTFALLENTKMNLHRMKRLDRTTELNEELMQNLQDLQKNYTWYVIIEGWCGDGSQIMPYLAKMAHATDKIQLKVLLRDENPEIMDSYLTNGTRSIPKLICVDENEEELFTWGSRPEEIQNQVLSFKQENPEASKMEFTKNLHLLYTKDKGEAIQSELNYLISVCE